MSTSPPRDGPLTPILMMVRSLTALRVDRVGIPQALTLVMMERLPILAISMSVLHGISFGIHNHILCVIVIGCRDHWLFRDNTIVRAHHCRQESGDTGGLAWGCLLQIESEEHILIYNVVHKVVIDPVVIHIHNEGSVYEFSWGNKSRAIGKVFQH